jgi:hypothetical protein
MPPHLLARGTGLRHDRISLYLSTGTQSAVGDRAALVLPQPLPGLKGTAAMLRMHRIVMPRRSIGRRHEIAEAMERDRFQSVRSRAPAPGDTEMTNKPDSKPTKKDPHPGMMGDGTEEQNLGQPGNPAARIKKDEVDAAFNKDNKKK